MQEFTEYRECGFLCQFEELSAVDQKQSTEDRELEKAADEFYAKALQQNCSHTPHLLRMSSEQKEEAGSANRTSPAASRYAGYTQNYIRIGDSAPDFNAETQQGLIKFHEYLGNNWGILFSHPADFTPVCTSELAKLAKLQGEFDKRNTKVVAISVDRVEDHKRWLKDVNQIGNIEVNYPIIADNDRKVSVLYGMLDQTHLVQSSGEPKTVRSVFFIDPTKTVRTIITYPAPSGRNFSEILRVLDSLQLAFTHKVATPADWQPGDETIVLPGVSNEEATKLFPKGFKEVRPWFRTTPDPKVAA